MGGLRSGTTGYLAHLFAKNGAGKAEMLDLLGDGKWAKVVFESDYDVSKEVQGVFLSRLIPLSWPINQRIHPVVIVRDWENAVLPTTVTVPNIGVRTFSKEAEAQNATVQYGGKTLWLMDVHDCDGPTLKACSAPIMYPLNGLSELYVGNTKWSNVNYADMAIS